MKNEKHQLKGFMRVIILLFIVLTSATGVFANCEGRTPGNLLEELKAAIQTPSGPYVYSFWPQCLEPYFQPWRLPQDGGGGSQNLPVVAAAVGLFRFPTTFMRDNGNTTTSNVRYMDWWITYLESQLGDTPPPQPRLRYFKGSEPFSTVYDGPVVAAIISVRYWAQINKTNGNAQIAAAAIRLEGLARRYLRANWAIYGLAAGNNSGRWFEVPGRDPVPTQSTVPSGTQYNPWMLIRPNGTLRYGGRLIALAGARSEIAHWAGDSRPPLLDRAIKNIPAKTDENPPQKDLLDYLNNEKWPKTLPENLYALNSGDIGMLNTLRTSGSNASSFLPWLVNIRTITTFRILGWLGQRASLMESNPNWATANTYAALYNVSDQKLTILFPWGDGNSAPADGWCRLEPGLIRASNEGSTDPRHPVKYVSLNLPFDPPLFHIVLSPYTEAYLQ